MARIITPKALLSYPHLDAPYAGAIGGKEKYSCTGIFLKGTDLSEMQKAVVDTAVERWGKKAVAMLSTGALKSPFRTDAAAKGYPEGSTFINVRSDNRPGVVDGALNDIPLEDVKDRLYAGCGVILSISPFAYDTSGNKGVSFGLNNVQLVDETLPRIDGRKAAKDEFAAVEMATVSMDDLDAE